jgi:hypothetical protein
MQSALKGSLPLPGNLLKSYELFSRPCLNSLPCGSRGGVFPEMEVVPSRRDHAQRHDADAPGQVGGDGELPAPNTFKMAQATGMPSRKWMTRYKLNCLPE